MTLLQEMVTADSDFVDLGQAIRETANSCRLNESARMGLTIGAAMVGVAAYHKMKSSQRNTIKLFAQDAYEKKMFTSVVDELTKSGKYKITKSKYAGTGKYWELKRVSTT
jgi:hypothetical protein